jgi:hypothetical protein
LRAHTPRNTHKHTYALRQAIMCTHRDKDRARESEKASERAREQESERARERARARERERERERERKRKRESTACELTGAEAHELGEMVACFLVQFTPLLWLVRPVLCVRGRERESMCVCVGGVLGVQG